MYQIYCNYYIYIYGLNGGGGGRTKVPLGPDSPLLSDILRS